MKKPSLTQEFMVIGAIFAIIIVLVSVAFALDAIFHFGWFGF